MCNPSPYAIQLRTHKPMMRQTRQKEQWDLFPRNTEERFTLRGTGGRKPGKLSTWVLKPNKSGLKVKEGVPSFSEPQFLQLENGGNLFME